MDFPAVQSRHLTGDDLPVMRGSIVDGGNAMFPRVFFALVVVLFFPTPAVPYYCKSLD
jgi:hypothetical protein